MAAADVSHETLTALLPPKKWPSGIRRVRGYAPYLKQRGATLHTCHPKEEWAARNPSHWLPRLADKVNRTWELNQRLDRFEARHYRRSIDFAVQQAEQGSVLLLQWLAFDQAARTRLRKATHRLVYDFDDAVFLKFPEEVDACIRVADIVLCGSHFGLEYALGLNNASVLVPTCVPLKKNKPYVDRPNQFVIGWVGSHSTSDYLDLVIPAINTLAQSYPAEIHFMTLNADRDLRKMGLSPSVTWRAVNGITEEEFDTYIPQFDVGIMPLQDTDWEKGKCGAKALWYMSYGVPVISSPVGEAHHILEHGRSGLLASETQDWVDQLTELKKNAGTREIFGRAGRSVVERRYSSEACFPLFYQHVFGRSPAV